MNRHLHVHMLALDSKQGDNIHNQLSTSMLNLLIVEDVMADVELITLSLHHAGIHFRHETADSSAQCWTLLKEQAFDAVLSDYRLPALQAPQVFQLVNELQPKVPFVLVTGHLKEESAVECTKSGMTDYVLKDRLYRLPGVLKRALTEAELKRQRQAAIAKIKQQVWRESVLNRIVQAIRETLVLEDVLRTTATQLREALQVDACLVVHPNAHQQMVVQCIDGVIDQFQELLHCSCSLATYCQDSSQAKRQLTAHRSDLVLPVGIRQFLDDYQLHSILITPLKHQHEYLGALTLCHTHAHHVWDEDERSLVQAIADQCAIAIYQAHLYQKAQQELEHRRQIETQLQHDAFHDELTGLPNRALFMDRLSHAMQIARRHQDEEGHPPIRNFAVLFIDLDDFRYVNDSLGHYAGDFLLREVAQRMGHCLRIGDTLARTSGDEFAILLEDVTGIDDIIEIVEELQAVLQQPINLNTESVVVSMCIGIVINAPSYSDAAQFLRDADTAMYQAKKKGRGQYQVFDGSMHTHVKQRLRLENDLRRALACNEFTLAYQPIVCLSTNELAGFEALIRWCDPVQGPLYPDQFIPVAEQTGLILPIGEWVLHQACLQWKQWLRRWPKQMQRHRISVNLSAKQFAQSNLIEQIDNTLKATEVSGCCLKLEITESALIENKVTALETLKQLKARDIQVAMDDFGTGYSSLGYLLQFPKDVLKIDKSFVSNLENSLQSQVVVKTVISLGYNLGLELVGEGIETAYQAEFLAQEGCLFGQGNWFSTPMTSKAAENMLQIKFG